jgi:hypothetical protein
MELARDAARPGPLSRSCGGATAGRTFHRVLASRDDRLFPPEFQRRVARDRLGLPADEIPGGHLVALSGPVELADRLESSPAATDPIPS